MHDQLKPKPGDLVRVRLPLMAGDAPWPHGLIVKEHSTKRQGMYTTIYEIQELTEGKTMYCSATEVEVI